MSDETRYEPGELVALRHKAFVYMMIPRDGSVLVVTNPATLVIIVMDPGEFIIYGGRSVVVFLGDKRANVSRSDISRLAETCEKNDER